MASIRFKLKQPSSVLRAAVATVFPDLHTPALRTSNNSQCKSRPAGAEPQSKPPNVDECSSSNT